MDRLVVMFGGSGFLGRYIAQELLSAGVRVRFAERDPRRAWFLKPLGNLGQTQFVAADVTHRESVARAVQGADAVINLVGILKGAFQKVHVEGARNVAEAAAAAGVRSLVHISALGADANAGSAYGRSKGEGEQAVRAAFPEATILRPSIIFGPEDQFTNRFAAMIRALPIVPVVRSGVKFQPIYVADVARAAVRALLEPEIYAGQTYELGGPETVTMAEIFTWLGRATGRDRFTVEIPDAAAQGMARLMGWLPGAPITWDQWQMLQKDNIVAADAAGIEAFGITPMPADAVAGNWLVQYRRQGRFHQGYSVA